VPRDIDIQISQVVLSSTLDANERMFVRGHGCQFGELVV